MAADDDFYEVYVKADESLREARDPKGHYAKARAGHLADFSGINGEYQAPERPELTIDTAVSSIEDAVETLFEFVRERIAR